MNKIGNIVIVVVLIVAVAAVVNLKRSKSEDSGVVAIEGPVEVTTTTETEGPVTTRSESSKALPRLVDIGSDTCIPCKMMAPILNELKKEYAGSFKVDFLDIRTNPAFAEDYGIQLIPTQIFYDASGQERFRHEGFMSKEDILKKWAELGVDLSGPKSELPAFERLEPAQVDKRPKDKICYMCDGDINPKTLVAVQTNKGPVRLCSPHCYFIMYSCLTEDKTGFEKNVSATDWATGQTVPAASAVFLSGQDENTGKSWIKAFADRDAAVKQRSTSGGNILAFGLLQEKELSHRCGFCDRACYPQDAAEVVVEGGIHTWGCCSHCALGVAARTGKDIEVHEKDRLTGEKIIVKTLDGKVASLDPSTAVAWFGQRQKADDTWGSAGCFHQGFFVNEANLKKWIEQNPYETGKLISISKALADKMKLSPQQIQKACKIGECVPK